MSQTYFATARPFALLAMASACLGLVLSASGSGGEEPETKSKPPTAGEATKEPAAKTDSAEDLLKQLLMIQRKRPTGNSRQEFIESYKEIQREVLAAADKVLAHPDAAGEKGDQLSAAAIGAKVSALRLLGRLGDAKAKDEVKQELAKHAGDKRPKVAEVIELVTLAERFTPAPNADPAALKAMTADAKQYFSNAKIAPQHVMIMQGLASQLEQHDAEAEAADAYKTFGELLSKSDDKRLAALGRQFAGTARRLGLMGQPMEVYGTQLDGKPLDWKSYQGKVVLVDFWATWCGPCVRELPNILKNYEAYHDRGFEVIGVSVDEKKPDVEEFVAQRKIPWTMVLDKEFKSAGKEDSLASYYGVSGIPTVILVDKEGKVVSLNARGPELGKMLAQLLGPPDVKKADEKKPEEAKKE